MECLPISSCLLFLFQFGFQLYRNFRHFVCLEENGSKPTAVGASAHANCRDKSTERQKTRTSERTSNSEEGLAKERQETNKHCSASGSTTECPPNGGRTRAQIPVTAQTARLLSTHQPSPPVQALSCPKGGRETQKTPPVVGPHEQHTNAGTTLRAMHHQTGMETASSGCRPGSPDLPPPPPPELLTSLHGTLKSVPPAPPRRDESTQLSLRRPETKNAAQTKNFILNLQRTIGQKCERGAEGLVQLEMPLPPPPLYSDEPSYLDLGDLPPPPAELLEELKLMNRRPKQPPPTHIKCSRH